MKKSLSSKVALITGAARRIGAAIAQKLHQAGMNVIIHYNSSEEEALKLCQKMNQERAHSAFPIRADLHDDESLKTLVAKSVKMWGRLDVLINNASRFYRTTLGKVSDFAWNDLMSSNLKAPFFLSQAAAPHLIETKGVIINITDIHGVKPLKDYSVYSLSKGALNMLTGILAKELAPYVRVNAISPGAILWPEGDNTLSELSKDKIIGKTLLERAGAPEEIANAALFFIYEADYITGQVLSIDGGRLLVG